MDEIQKVLVEAGRKDLAQKYYLKVAGKIKKIDADEALNNIKKILDKNPNILGLVDKAMKNEKVSVKLPKNMLILLLSGLLSLSMAGSGGLHDVQKKLSPKQYKQLEYVIKKVKQNPKMFDALGRRVTEGPSMQYLMGEGGSVKAPIVKAPIVNK